MSRYRVGVLLYFRSVQGQLLLIKRERAPNAGLWCAVGGKLEMETGESPVECARREAFEEIGIELKDSDLLLRAMLSEKDYEETGHWLMFVYEIKKRLSSIPSSIDEGRFNFFNIGDLDELEMPWLDKLILTDKLLDPDGEEFHAIHVSGQEASDAGVVIIEESIGSR